MVTMRKRKDGRLHKIRGTGNGQYKHGMEGTRTYRIWAGMKNRCQNPNAQFWERYGGRGITVCDEWQSFKGFYDSMGEAPEGYSIERIDNDRGYNPENCCWADNAAQGRNKRGVKLDKGMADSIRFLAVWYCQPYTQIAKQFSISHSHVERIVNGKVWI